MLFILISKCFSSVHLSLAARLNTDCLMDGSPALFLISSSKLAYPVPVIGIVFPPLASAMAKTLVIAASIAICINCFLNAFVSAIPFVLLFLLNTLWLASFRFYNLHHNMFFAFYEITLMVCCSAFLVNYTWYVHSVYSGKTVDLYTVH